MLIGATPTSTPLPWKQSLSNTTLKPPVVCGKGGLGVSASTSETPVSLGCVLTPIALAGWQAPCDASDFMAGGTPFQALTDIAGGDVGGGKS